MTTARRVVAALFAPALVAIAMVITSTAWAETAVWIGPETGDWNDPSNWSTGAVPDGFDTVIIDNNPSQATEASSTGASINAESLFIDSQDTLRTHHSWIGNISLAGSLAVDENYRLTTLGNIQIEESGLLQIDGEVKYNYQTTLPYSQLIWNRGTIAGTGSLSTRGYFWNEGAVASTTPNETLSISLGDAFYTSPLEEKGANSGLIQAASGGALTLFGGGSWTSRLRNYQDDTLGKIEALADSTLTLRYVELQGGILHGEVLDDSYGRLIVETSSLNSVQLQGRVELLSSSFEGDTHNTGTMLLQGTGGMSGTLTGNGVVQVYNTGSRSSYSLSSFTNTDNLICGGGRLEGDYFTNLGTVEAGAENNLSTGPLGPLTLTVSQIANGGILRATPGNQLTLYNSSGEEGQLYNYAGQTHGVIEALPDSVVELNAVEIFGGTLRSIAATPGLHTYDGIVTGNEVKLIDLSLEGPIGDTHSNFLIEGRIDNADRLIAQRVDVDSSAEIVGGTIDLSSETSTLQIGSTYSATEAASLTLTETTLRIGSCAVITNNYSASLVNNGTIIAGLDNGTSIVEALTNNGLIEVEPGGKLSVGAIRSTPGHAGIVYAAPGSTVDIGYFTDGIIGCPAGLSCEEGYGEIKVGYFYSGTNNAAISMQNGQLNGTLTNNGTISLQQATLNDFVYLTGSGEVLLTNQTIQASGATLFNGPAHTIRGRGRLSMNNGSFMNQGTLSAEGGTLDVSGFPYFTQSGTLMSADDGLSRLVIQTSTFFNDGLIIASGQGIEAYNIVNRAGGEIHIHSRLTASVINEHGAIVTGEGTLASKVRQTGSDLLINSGLVAPGNSIGTFTIGGNFEQTTEGTLQIEVAGFASELYDQLVLSSYTGTGDGEASLAGILEFVFDDALTPQAGDQLEFMRSISYSPNPQITGQFDSIVGLPELDEGLAWRMLYEPTAVSLLVTYAGDFNADGSVDLADYTVWRNQLGATNLSPYTGADSDGDGDVDQHDYLAWHSHFGLHGASETQSVAIPEPTSAMLVVLGLSVVLLSTQRRTPKPTTFASTASTR